MGTICSCAACPMLHQMQLGSVPSPPIRLAELCSGISDSGRRGDRSRGPHGAAAVTAAAGGGAFAAAVGLCLGGVGAGLGQNCGHVIRIMVIRKDRSAEGGGVAGAGIAEVRRGGEGRIVWVEWARGARASWRDWVSRGD